MFPPPLDNGVCFDPLMADAPLPPLGVFKSDPLGLIFPPLGVLATLAWPVLLTAGVPANLGILEIGVAVAAAAAGSAVGTGLDGVIATGIAEGAVNLDGVVVDDGSPDGLAGVAIPLLLVFIINNCLASGVEVTTMFFFISPLLWLPLVSSF